MIVVAKRYPGELHAVTEFVQPRSYMVLELAGKLPQGADALAAAAYRWIRSNIRYPPGPAPVADWHYQESFALRFSWPRPVPMFRRSSRDFWQFPAETLALRTGDCEDQAILLCSLLRTAVGPQEVFVTIGEYAGFGHAWVLYRGRVLDTALDAGVFMAPEQSPYRPWFRFNDVSAVASA